MLHPHHQLRYQNTGFYNSSSIKSTSLTSKSTILVFTPFRNPQIQIFNMTLCPGCGFTNNTSVYCSRCGGYLGRKGRQNVHQHQVREALETLIVKYSNISSEAYFLFWQGSKKGQSDISPDVLNASSSLYISPVPSSTPL